MSCLLNVKPRLGLQARTHIVHCPLHQAAVLRTCHCGMCAAAAMSHTDSGVGSNMHRGLFPLLFLALGSLLRAETSAMGP